MKTIYNKKTNLVICVESDFIETDDFGVTDFLCKENFLITKFNPITNLFYDGAIQEEIAESTKEQVPLSVSRMGLKLQLRRRNIDISEVEKTIRELPDWMMSPLEKDLAVIKFDDAAYYDRYNADYNLVATMMGLTQEDLDEIHINGNKII